MGCGFEKYKIDYKKGPNQSHASLVVMFLFSDETTKHTEQWDEVNPRTSLVLTCSIHVVTWAIWAHEHGWPPLYLSENHACPHQLGCMGIMCDSMRHALLGRLRLRTQAGRVVTSGWQSGWIVGGPGTAVITQASTSGFKFPHPTFMSCNFTLHRYLSGSRRRGKG